MDKKISQLTSATTPLTGTEELAIVQGGSTVKATAQDIADLAGGPVLPVLNTYPVTTPASAGTRFWYKGNEWHYMTQAEIDSAGWTGLVSVGFPAPVNKSINLNILYTGTNINFAYFGGANSSLANGSLSPAWVSIAGKTFTIDFLGLGDPARTMVVPSFSSGPGSEYNLSIRNAQLLKNLEDIGTQAVIYFRHANLTATALNQLFTDLPATTKTATINVADNPGSATCNPTIATAKGYTVVTS